MKRVILSVATAVILSTTSCVELPDLNPNTNSDVEVTSIMETQYYDMTTPFNYAIDINGNGTIDFRLMGGTFNSPTMGHMEIINLQGEKDANRVIAGQSVLIDACDTQFEFLPVKALTNNFIVGPGGGWAPFGSLYAQGTPGGLSCSVHRNFIPQGVSKYFGVMFEEDGEIFYGWVKIKATDMTEWGLPECAENYTVEQVAYNIVPGTSARIPL